MKKQFEDLMDQYGGLLFEHKWYAFMGKAEKDFFGKKKIPCLKAYAIDREGKQYYIIWKADKDLEWFFPLSIEEI